MIELNLEPKSNCLVLDTDSRKHIMNCMQGLQGIRRLGQNEFSLRVGNGATVPAFAVEDYDLILPNGNVFILNNIHYIPNVTQNIVSIPLLDKSGYKITQENNSCTIFKDSVKLFSISNVSGHYLFNENASLINLNHKRKCEEIESSKL